MKKINSAAIIGMGALGLMYGDRISASLGPGAVCFVADADRIARYENMTFTVNGVKKAFVLKDSSTMGPVDLVIVAVKGTALDSALRTMERCVGPDTTIVSVLNGITSEQIIGRKFGMEKMVYSVAQGMDAVKFGGDLTYTKFGQVRIGILDREDQEARNRLDRVTEFFDRAGVDYVEESDIMYRIWGKFMLNVGINQVCMAYETNYGGALEPGEAYDTLVGAMEEVVKLANLEGVALSEKDLDSYIALIRTLSPTGMPSMRQDGLAHRRSEVEMFAGTVRTLAEKHGLPVPVNDRLYEKIQQMESHYMERN